MHTDPDTLHQIQLILSPKDFSFQFTPDYYTIYRNVSINLPCHSSEI